MRSEYLLGTIESALWRFLRSCWTLCRVALSFLAPWHGVVVYREHMAGLLARFYRISIAMQLLESAATWCADHQCTIPVQLFICVLPWVLSLLLSDQTVLPSQTAPPDVVERATAKPMTGMSQLPVVGFTAALSEWLFKKRLL